MTISYDDFAKIDIRVGTIIAVDPFPEARKPAFKLTVDFGGDIGTRRSSAQITDHYTAESLVGRQILAVVNFPPKRIGPFTSEILCLGVPDADGAVVLVGPDQAVPNGGRLF
ncbi:tRNA-binding protein [Azospirillum griseum]|uniref:tRNA-binding protein n=1 Tax=Azospirillum griseum TaxID=2496639 RepID=A0A3S0KAH6_9PROT|nr:tRNA-binding protein [Azospirillum griseum]RTR19214.1 tRNA-binding protein [Azospirillum griseum]